MTLKLILIPHPLDRRITPRLRKRKLHLLAKQLKALHLINRLLRAIYRVEHDERLSFRLQVGFRDNVDDGAVFGEQFAEGFD